MQNFIPKSDEINEKLCYEAYKTQKYKNIACDGVNNSEFLLSTASAS